MEFSKINPDKQREFLFALSKKINSNKALKLYFDLSESSFNEYCYGIKNSNNENYKTLIYFIPSKKPIVLPPLSIPEDDNSDFSNTEGNLRITVSLVMSKVKEVTKVTQFFFPLKKDKISGKAILFFETTYNCKKYTPDYLNVIGVIPNFNELNNNRDNIKYNQVKFKNWDDSNSDDNIIKLIDMTFENSKDPFIESGEFKNTLMEYLKEKKIIKNNCIIMGKDNKAIGIAFPNIDRDNINELVVFGFDYYYGVISKMRNQGYSNILFVESLKNLKKQGANIYKGKIHKQNSIGIKMIKKFGFELYDTVLSINFE